MIKIWYVMNAFKLLSVLKFTSNWVVESLEPDEDKKVRITIDELVVLLKGICNVFGWIPEIVDNKENK